LWEWDTTKEQGGEDMGGKETKLLGHNGEHGIELLTPVRFEEYEVPDREPEEGGTRGMRITF